MTIQSIYLFLTLLFVFPQQDCQIIKKDKEKFQTQSTKSYNLVDFGNIPSNNSYDYNNINNAETPFTIDNNCLMFKITHMGCSCEFEMLWDGTYQTDEKGKTIVCLKFILSWTDPCKRLNHTNLKYDLTEILKNNCSDELFVRFDGYDKLIRIR